MGKRFNILIIVSVVIYIVTPFLVISFFPHDDDTDYVDVTFYSIQFLVTLLIFFNLRKLRSFNLVLGWFLISYSLYLDIFFKFVEEPEPLYDPF